MKYLKTYETFTGMTFFDEGADLNEIWEVDAENTNVTGHSKWVTDEELKALESQGLIFSDDVNAEVYFFFEKDRKAIKKFLKLFKDADKYNL